MKNTKLTVIGKKLSDKQLKMLQDAGYAVTVLFTNETSQRIYVNNKPVYKLLASDSALQAVSNVIANR
jgi:hypothetical protein